jgi:aspartate aminotransferase
MKTKAVIQDLVTSNFNGNHAFELDGIHRQAVMPEEATTEAVTRSNNPASIVVSTPLQDSVSAPMRRVQESLAAVQRFFTDSPWAARAGKPDVSDFAFGNPHEMPLPGFTEALQKWSAPQNKDWHAYKENEPASRAIIAASLRERRGSDFAPEDIFLTNGGFAALAVALHALVNPGDEVIFISPPWFFYEALILAAHGSPVRVHMDPHTFDLDLAAIEAAITPKTRAIIINSPNNPTGKIYPPATLRGLAQLLTRRASATDGPSICCPMKPTRGLFSTSANFPAPPRIIPIPCCSIPMAKRS